MSGGLDALETIGKKTMEVLSEGDPGEEWALVCPVGHELYRAGQEEGPVGSRTSSYSISTAQGGKV